MGRLQRLPDFVEISPLLPVIAISAQEFPCPLCTTEILGKGVFVGIVPIMKNHGRMVTQPDWTAVSAWSRLEP